MKFIHYNKKKKYSLKKYVMFTYRIEETVKNPTETSTHKLRNTLQALTHLKEQHKIINILNKWLQNKIYIYKNTKKLPKPISYKYTHIFKENSYKAPGIIEKVSSHRWWIKHGVSLVNTTYLRFNDLKRSKFGRSNTYSFAIN